MIAATKGSSATVTIGGLQIHSATRAELAACFMADWRANRTRSALPVFSTSANGHVLALAARDMEFRAMLDQANHIDADGMPLVIASRYLARKALPERIATTDFIHDVARAAAGEPVRFFLLGASESENAEARAKLRALYPSLAMAGHHGFFNEGEEANIVAQIQTFKTDLLWVGLGVPREHRFVLRNREALRGVTWIKTCGGLFNFLSGSRKRAPLWVQQSGFEWLWRTLQEPARLGPRYLATNGEALRLMWRHRER